MAGPAPKLATVWREWRRFRGAVEAMVAGRWAPGRVAPAEVFPWLEQALIAGVFLGVAVAVWTGRANRPDLAVMAARGLLGAIVGGLLGTCAAWTWAVEARGRPVGPPERVRPLWDRWLDGGAPEPEEETEPPPAAAVLVEPGPPGVVPERARVRPRFVSADSGESLPLEDEVGPLLAGGERGAVRIVGEAGAGKSTALRHLARLVPPGAAVRVLDDPDPKEVAAAAARGLVLYSAADASYPKHRATYRLASWGEDERIEYLLGGDRRRCASVMDRLKRGKADWDWLGGSPELWRVVLDRMAAEESIDSLRQALRVELGTRLAEGELRRMVQSDCRAALLAQGGSTRPGNLVRRDCPDGVLLRLIRHRPVRLLLAAESMATELEGYAECAFLGERLPRDLVREVASLVTDDLRALARLRICVASGPRSQQPTAASLLHATGIGWRPDGSPLPRMAGAYLEGAAWAGAHLVCADLNGADLSEADLAGAVLDRALLQGARLVRARLRGASLEGVYADRADLSHADLASVRAGHSCFARAVLKAADLEGAWLRGARLWAADLTGARLARADLALADLEGADVAGADLAGAVLAGARLRGLKLSRARCAGARFAGADLSGCDLEGLELPAPDFEDADLRGALLTGSRMPGADFRGADLRDAGLAEVAWEGANLGRADLRGASFHLGSSRSGLVGSPIACEGSRTGFYTDDYDDQGFKAPEEIRKADLRGADLRGAKVDRVDFYLVDLRGARFDAEQARHFRRCGAILESRA